MSESNRDVRSHFGFSTTPFTREISVTKRWAHPQQNKILDNLQQVVKDRMSAALIAPAGCGKTMLLRTLNARLPEARYRIYYIKVANLSQRDTCREISFAIGCKISQQFQVLMRRIQEHMMMIIDHYGVRPVLMIDEAHELKPDVLTMFRVLTNFDMDSRLVVSILLSGQKPLERLLKRDDVRALTHRLAHYSSLNNLNRGDTSKYIAHRIKVAGGKVQCFDNTACDAVFEIGQGNLRATDRLCLKALQLAAAEGLPSAEQTHVLEARRQLWP